MADETMSPSCLNLEQQLQAANQQIEELKLQAAAAQAALLKIREDCLRGEGVGRIGSFEVLVQRLNALLAAQPLSALREMILAEREQCCKDVCHRCADVATYESAAQHTQDGSLQHLPFKWAHRTLRCYAEPIRERTEAESRALAEHLKPREGM